MLFYEEDSQGNLICKIDWKKLHEEADWKEEQEKAELKKAQEQEEFEWLLLLPFRLICLFILCYFSFWGLILFYGIIFHGDRLH